MTAQLKIAVTPNSSFLNLFAYLTASLFGRDLALDAKRKGVRFGVFAAPGLDRHCSVEGHFVFEDHDFLNVIQQELPSGRNLSSR
jgi:hypothetical protein